MNNAETMRRAISSFMARVLHRAVFNNRGRVARRSRGLAGQRRPLWSRIDLTPSPHPSRMRAPIAVPFLVILRPAESLLRSVLRRSPPLRMKRQTSAPLANPPDSGRRISSRYCQELLHPDLAEFLGILAGRVGAVASLDPLDSCRRWPVARRRSHSGDSVRQLLGRALRRMAC